MVAAPNAVETLEFSPSIVIIKVGVTVICDVI